MDQALIRHAYQHIQSDEINLVKRGIHDLETQLGTANDHDRIVALNLLEKGYTKLHNPLLLEQFFKTNIHFYADLITAHPDHADYTYQRLQLQLCQMRLIFKGQLPFESKETLQAIGLDILNAYERNQMQSRFEILGLEAMLMLGDLACFTERYSTPRDWYRGVLLKAVHKTPLISLMTKIYIRYGATYPTWDARVFERAFMVIQNKDSRLACLIALGNHQIVSRSPPRPHYLDCFQLAMDYAKPHQDDHHKIAAQIGLGTLLIHHHPETSQVHLKQAYEDASHLFNKTLLVEALLGLAQHPETPNPLACLHEANQHKAAVLNHQTLKKLSQCSFISTEQETKTETIEPIKFYGTQLVIQYRMEPKPIEPETLIAYYNKAKALKHIHFRLELALELAQRRIPYSKKHGHHFWLKRQMKHWHHIPKTSQFITQGYRLLNNEDDLSSLTCSSDQSQDTQPTCSK